MKNDYCISLNYYHYLLFKIKHETENGEIRFIPITHFDGADVNMKENLFDWLAFEMFSIPHKILVLFM